MKIDKQTVYDPETNKIDHAESARENLNEAGINLFQALMPDKFFIGAFAGVLGGLFKAITGGDPKDAYTTGDLLKSIGHDLADPFYQPVLAVKNLGDAAVHGIMAGVQALRD